MSFDVNVAAVGAWAAFIGICAAPVWVVSSLALAEIRRRKAGRQWPLGKGK